MIHNECQSARGIAPVGSSEDGRWRRARKIKLIHRPTLKGAYMTPLGLFRGPIRHQYVQPPHFGPVALEQSASWSSHLLPGVWEARSGPRVARILPVFTGTVLSRGLEA